MLERRKRPDLEQAVAAQALNRLLRRMLCTRTEQHCRDIALISLGYNTDTEALYARASCSHVLGGCCSSHCCLRERFFQRQPGWAILHRRRALLVCTSFHASCLNRAVTRASRIHCLDLSGAGWAC